MLDFECHYARSSGDCFVNQIGAFACSGYYEEVHGARPSDHYNAIAVNATTVVESIDDGSFVVAFADGVVVSVDDVADEDGGRPFVHVQSTSGSNVDDPYEAIPCTN